MSLIPKPGRSGLKRRNTSRNRFFTTGAKIALKRCMYFKLRIKGARVKEKSKRDVRPSWRCCSAAKRHSEAHRVQNYDSEAHWYFRAKLLTICGIHHFLRPPNLSRHQRFLEMGMSDKDTGSPIRILPKSGNVYHAFCLQVRHMFVIEPNEIHRQDQTTESVRVFQFLGSPTPQNQGFSIDTKTDSSTDLLVHQRGKAATHRIQVNNRWNFCRL